MLNVECFPQARALLLRTECDDAEGREGDFPGAKLVMPRLVICGDAAEVSNISAAVHGGIAIQHFAPFAGTRKALTVMASRHGREVEDHGNFASRVCVLTNEREHAVVVV